MARDGRYSVILSWYNTIGGIEKWNFTARKTYGWDIRNAQIAERDTFAEWDDNFLGASIDHDLVSLEANERVVVRSQDLTIQQINAISQIKLSARVIDETTGLAVRVDRRSFQFRTDHEKRHELSFTIDYPNEIIPIL